MQRGIVGLPAPPLEGVRWTLLGKLAGHLTARPLASDSAHSALWRTSVAKQRQKSLFFNILDVAMAPRRGIEPLFST